ncbi:uncharacterized protein VTP21DRAFT_3191 [Calcarisporiella thermophila]|uniref:uncharacterized protein n=1 Tax=Calcarisporiella thermophila TaxID=911321 RepID=UPI0037447DBC
MTDNDKCYPTTSLEDVLTLASSLEIETPVSTFEERRKLDSQLELVDAIDEALELSLELNKTKGEVAAKQDWFLAKDVLHPNEIDTKLQEINSLSIQLEQSLARQDEMLIRLKEPYIGPHIFLPAKYHSQVYDLVTGMLKYISHLPRHIDTIRWHHEFDTEDLLREQERISHEFETRTAVYAAIRERLERVSRLMRERGIEELECQ